MGLKDLRANTITTYWTKELKDTKMILLKITKLDRNLQPFKRLFRLRNYLIHKTKLTGFCKR